MTIGEHLQFSVLTAPVAAIDRRGLSQAWYSALYRTSGEPQTQAARNRPTPEKPPARSTEIERATCHQQGIAPSKLLRTHENVEIRGGSEERRAPRSALARKIERALLHPGAKARNGFF